MQNALVSLWEIHYFPGAIWNYSDISLIMASYVKKQPKKSDGALFPA